MIRWRFGILNPDWPHAAAFGWTVVSSSFIVWLVRVYHIMNFFIFCSFVSVFNFRQIVMYHFIWITSHIESCHPLKCLSALFSFFLRKLFFWPITNIRIVLQSVGSKYPCITLKLKLNVISVLACIGESMYRSSNCY